MALTKERLATQKRIEQICQLLDINYESWLAQKQAEFIAEKTDKAFEASLKLKKREEKRHHG